MRSGVWCIGAVCLGFVSAQDTRAAALKPGDVAPAYRISTFDKRLVSSDQLAGQVVIINFWATWCGPCKQELPALDLYYRHHGREGLQIFAVAVDGSVPDYQLRPLQTALSFSLAHRITGKGLAVLDGVPTSYVIDRDGIVRYALANAFNEASLEAVVGPLLARPAQTVPVAASNPR